MAGGVVGVVGVVGVASGVVGVLGVVLTSVDSIIFSSLVYSSSSVAGGVFCSCLSSSQNCTTSSAVGLGQCSMTNSTYSVVIGRCNV